jgi:hypothetical protein
VHAVTAWWQRERIRGALVRLAVALILPAPLGALLLSVYLQLASHFFPPPGGREPPSFLLMVGIFALSGYAFVGIQSAVYAFLMEYVVNVRVRGDATAVIIGAIIGAMSAVPFGGLFGLPMSLGLGFLVGLPISILLRRMYKAANSAMQPTPASGRG